MNNCRLVDEESDDDREVAAGVCPQCVLGVDEDDDDDATGDARIE